MSVNPIFQRLSLLTGLDVLAALARTNVIIFGVGGVGSWCAEALTRSGIGNISIVDSDIVCVTNINRQIQATEATIGQSKVAVLKRRLEEINPQGQIRSFGKVFSRETADSFGIERADYVIDAIDSLTHKLDLIEFTCRAGVSLFSAMGMAQKLDPTQLKTADIWETKGCPLARLVRSGLRKRGFTGHFTTVYSAERLPLQEVETPCGSVQCLCPSRSFCQGEDVPIEWCSSKKVINGSAVTVTATAGMILAGLVIQDIYSQYNRPQSRSQEASLV
jgi:tRNA A37 threonylcarbamoyladenosine dehydratase